MDDFFGASPGSLYFYSFNFHKNCIVKVYSTQLQARNNQSYHDHFYSRNYEIILLFCIGNVLNVLRYPKQNNYRLQHYSGEYSVDNKYDG